MQSNSFDGSIDVRRGHAFIGSHFDMAGGHVYFGNALPNIESGIIPKPSTTVPFARDPDFVERGNILNEVDSLLGRQPRRAALVGLGGVGKSQLAIEHAYRIYHNDSNTWVFWIHAGSPERINEGYQVIAERLQLDCRQDPQRVLWSVKSWLERNIDIKWLIIFDSADDSATFFSSSSDGAIDKRTELAEGYAPLVEYIPHSDSGSVLFTSRNNEVACKLVGGNRYIIRVSEMDDHSALSLLSKKLDSPFDETEGCKLVRALDYMPLAITQATSYINQSYSLESIETYLNTLQASDNESVRALSMDVGDIRRDGRSASNSIILTWIISFERIRTERRSASELLSLMSCFNSQGIPKRFLGLWVYNGNHPTEKLRKDQNDDYDSDGIDKRELIDDLRVLQDYSLISMTKVSDTPGNPCFEMHRLVQKSTREWLRRNGNIDYWNAEYVDRIGRLLVRKKNRWRRAEINTLLPHIMSLSTQQPTARETESMWIELMTIAGLLCYEFKMPESARTFHTRCLEVSQTTLGPEHPSTLECMERLVRTLNLQKKYEEAESLGRRALEGFEKVLGKEHQDTLDMSMVLAAILINQMKYEEAEDICKRTIEYQERLLGEVHSDTLQSIWWLMLALLGQKNLDQALKLGERALELVEKVFGEENVKTSIWKSQVAMVLYWQRSYEQAEKLQGQALGGLEKSLGKEHHKTVSSKCTLSVVLTCLGRHEQAEELARQALEAYENFFGEEDPWTLECIVTLAGILQSQGKSEEAEALERRAERVKKALADADIYHG